MNAITLNPPTIHNPGEALEDMANSMGTTGALIMTALGQLETVESYIANGSIDAAKSAINDTWATIWAVSDRNKIDKETAFAIREKMDANRAPILNPSEALRSYLSISAIKPTSDAESDAHGEMASAALWTYADEYPATIADAVTKFDIFRKEGVLVDARAVEIIGRDLSYLAGMASQH